MAKRPQTKPTEKRLEMLDGRIYFTFDNWVTVFQQKGNQSTQVTGEEANLIRFLGTAQETASP